MRRLHPKKHCWFLVLLLSFISAPGPAQNFHFERHNHEQGLSSSQVLSMDQDGYGHLWLATFSTDVIYQFDGRTFTPHVIPGLLPSERFRLLRCGRDEKIYLLTSKRIFVYDGSRVTSRDVPSQFLPALDAGFMIDSRNRIWLIGRDSKVFVSDEASFTEVTPDLQMNARALTVFEINKMVYVISVNREVRTLGHEGRFEVVDQLEGMPDEGELEFFSAGANALVSATRSMAYHYDLVSGTMRKAAITLPGDRSFTGLEWDGDDGIWILSHSTDHALSFVDYQRRGDHSLISGVEGFTRAFVVGIEKDVNGSLWFLTDGDGLIELKKLSVVPVCRDEILPTCMMLLDRTLLVGTYRGGLYEIIDGKAKPWSQSALLGRKLISDMDTVGHELLIATGERSIYSYNRRSKKMSELKFDQLPVRTIEPSGDTLILGTNDGLLIYAAGKFTRIHAETKTNLIISQILKIAGHKYLVATQNAGLFSWDGSGFLKEVNVVDATFVTSLRDNGKGGIWVSGDSQKLWLLDKDLVRARTYRLDPSMDRIISNLEVINDTTLLVGGMTTLYKIGIRDTMIRQVKRFAGTDGFAGGEFFVNSFRKNADSTINILTSSLFRYYPSFDKNRRPEPTFLKRISFSNVKGLMPDLHGNGFYQIPINQQLEKDWNNVAVDFAMNGLHDVVPFYQYKMEGQDDDWSAPSATEEAIFRHLPPGKYTFKVRSSLNRLEWGEEAKLQFEILPAFWQTLPFMLLMVFLALVLIFIAMRIHAWRSLNQYKRIQSIRVEESQKLRKQMAMDFHDEMGNKLASMLAYSELMKAHGNDRMEKSQLDHFSGILRDVYSGTRDFIWSIDIKSNNLIEVLSYLRDFGSVFFEKHKIRFLVEQDILNEKFEYWLPEGYNRQIVLIFKEAMSNVVKHSHADTVIFDASREGDNFTITLRDNGLGFSTKHTAGAGLKNMKKRSAFVDGKLQVESMGGVTVSLVLFLYEKHNANQD